MKNGTPEWNEHVFPHGPLRPIAPGVWEVTGSTPRGPVPRNMVVHRLPDGGLWLHSVIALDDSGMQALLALGRPSVMVVPNPIHRLDAGVYKKRFSELKVVCPAAIRAKVEEKVPVDDVCESFLPSQGIVCAMPDGLKPFELAYFLPTPEGKVLVVTDCLMNIPHLPGFGGWVLSLVGSTGFFGITRIGRLIVLRDRRQFGSWLEEMSKRSDLRAVCIAHGDSIVERVSDRLSEARRRLI